MQRVFIALAALTLFAALSSAQKPEEQKQARRFQPPEVISAVEADYPVRSIAWGTVILQVTIDPSGEIEQVKVIKDVKSLTPQAEKAVKKWKFKPATLDGKPVGSTIVVAFTFNPPVYNPTSTP